MLGKDRENGHANGYGAHVDHAIPPSHRGVRVYWTHAVRMNFKRTLHFAKGFAYKSRMHDVGNNVQKLNFATVQSKKCRCVRRIIPCEYCLMCFEGHRMKKHLTVCSQFPVACSQRCGQVLARDALTVHISEECPKIILKCEFADSGCRSAGTRKEMSEHMEKDVVRHVSMSHLRMQQQLGDLKEQMRSVEFTCCWRVTEWSKKVEACGEAMKRRRF